MGCGSWCVYYKDRNKVGICNNCSSYEGKRSRFELASIDLNKLHTIAIRNVMQKIKNSIPRLSECLHCQQHSLFYNSINDNFECLSIACAFNKKPILSASKDYIDVINSLKTNRIIPPIELTELEYDIYKNYLKTLAIHTEYHFEVIIKYQS